MFFFLLFYKVKDSSVLPLPVFPFFFKDQMTYCLSDLTVSPFPDPFSKPGTGVPRLILTDLLWVHPYCCFQRGELREGQNALQRGEGLQDPFTDGDSKKCVI